MATRTSIEAISAGGELQLTDYERAVARMYDGKQQDFNLLLGRETQLVHHHFGIGAVGRDFAAMTQAEINATMHDLENAQVSHLIDALGPMTGDDRVLDGGSGRAGTAILLHEATGCWYDGVTISSYQCEFSRTVAAAKGYSRLRFHLRNMLDTGFSAGTFSHVLTNETTMYIDDMHALCAEFARVLVGGGRYAFATWCYDELVADVRTYIDPIDEHYLCRMHSRGEYFHALADKGFVPTSVVDLSEQAVPYWLLRNHSEHKTGVEEMFIRGYARGAVRYLVVGAQLVAPKGIHAL
jgi:geranyl diphosphate 2-C-methyltransferase